MLVGKFVMSDYLWQRLCTTPLAGARTVRAFSQTTLSALSRVSRATAVARCTYITSIRSQKGAPPSPLRTGVSSSALRITAGFTAGYGASSRSGSGVLTTTHIRRVGWSASGDSIASLRDLSPFPRGNGKDLELGRGMVCSEMLQQGMIDPPVETPRPCTFCGTYNDRGR
jgi:hypothetical protein